VAFLTVGGHGLAIDDLTILVDHRKFQIRTAEINPDRVRSGHGTNYLVVCNQRSIGF
jgi:hypothetical protein